MSSSDTDTRRQTAEGTNFMDPTASAEQPIHMKKGGGGGGFMMDPNAEKQMLEEFKRSDPDYEKKQRAAAAAPTSVGVTEGAGIRFNGFRPDMTINSDREREIQEYIASHQTWRANVPLKRWFEYWRLRADAYPYVKQSDAQENFFLRGITCHPRLSEFPTCREVIRDYFTCRDEAKLLALFNPCAPMKEQLSACINMVFLRNHARGDKKFNEGREQKYDHVKEAKLTKMIQNADDSIKERSEFKD